MDNQLFIKYVLDTLKYHKIILEQNPHNTNKKYATPRKKSPQQNKLSHRKIIN